MIPAFHGKESIKAGLLERIDRHVANGTLIVGATFWDGSRGSALGVAVESVDLTAYRDSYGYPLALAGLLDPLVTLLRDPAMTIGFARAWVEQVASGADLSGVPGQLVLVMLEEQPSMPSFAGPLIDLHRQEMCGEIQHRRIWAGLRADIVAAADVANDPWDRALLDLCEAACWPAGSSRSILTTMLGIWANLGELAPDPDWPAADRERASAILASLWDEHGGAVEGDSEISYPTLFAARDPDLAHRFENNLDRVNRLYADRITALSQNLLGCLAEAPLCAGF